MLAPHHAHLCSEHFAECDFANLIEYRISKRNLKPTAFPSVQKADCRTPETKRTINEYAKQTFDNNNKEIKGPSVSASFNGNRVKNYPKPWTCPLKELCFGG